MTTTRLPQHPLPPELSSSPTALLAELKKKENIAVEKTTAQPPPRNQPQLPPRKEYMKQTSLQQQQEQEAAKNAAEQQMQLLQLQEAAEFTHMFNFFISRGHPEHVASQLARDKTMERYKQQQPPPAHGGRPQPNPVYLRDSLHPSDFSFRPTAYTPPSDQHQVMPTPPPRALPSPPEFTFPNLEAYPVVWQGYLGLKTELATVQFHYVSGCKELAKASLPTMANIQQQPTDLPMPTLKIGQRMRIEPSHLEGVEKKMEQKMDHCILLALPCGKDTRDVEEQSRHLRSHFITYLQLKGAAGIVNVTSDAPSADGLNSVSHVVHVFPNCDFANNTMAGIAPDLLARVAEIEHMVIIITTTT